MGARPRHLLADGLSLFAILGWAHALGRPKAAIELGERLKPVGKGDFGDSGGTAGELLTCFGEADFTQVIKVMSEPTKTPTFHHPLIGYKLPETAERVLARAPSVIAPCGSGESHP